MELSEAEHLKVVRLNKGSWLNRLWFETIELPKLVANIDPDLIISLQNMPIRGCRQPQYVYLHQSLQYCPKRFSFLKSVERSLAIRQHLICEMYRRTLPKADRIFVQTNWIKEATKRWIGWEERSADITVVPFALDVERLPIRAYEGQQTRMFFYPARADVYKNHEVVVEACKNLVARGIDEFKVLFSIGPRENAYAQRLATTSHHLPIEFAGNLPYESVWDLYSKSVLLFPSYLETCGLPLLEGREAGTRIIASDLPFSHEALDGYANAEFFKHDSPQQLATLMQASLDQPRYVPCESKQNVMTTGLVDAMIATAAERKPKVLFITNIPSPYRVDFFNELGKFCDLTVLFERAGSSERDAAWSEYAFTHFRGIVMRGKPIGVDKALCPEVVRHLKANRYDYVFCTDFLTPTGMLATHYMRRKGIPYYLESDGGFAGSGTGPKEKLKSRCIKGASAYFSTSAEHDKYYLRYGASEQRLVRYPFSSVWEREVLTEATSSEAKQDYRNELGITEKHVVLAVGQFIHRKGFDILLECARLFTEDTGFYIVGGEPTEAYVETRAKYDLRHVHFVGFKKKTELNAYYGAADVFVLPTREDIWGLVINEAMANGLPVITTTRCLAGTQMIAEGVNGCLVEPEDVSTLAARIKAALADDELRTSMSQYALQTAKRYTIGTMVQAHLEYPRTHEG